ncbi:MAG: pentapeptide repeat-containing protein [Alphaproteobacteria bacterium]
MNVRLVFTAIVTLALTQVSLAQAGRGSAMMISDPVQQLLVTNACVGCDLRGADLRRTVLAGADLAGADLRGAVMEGADLTGANLTGADLSDANLINGTLAGADLRGAVLTLTDLSGADLTDAIVTQEALGEAVICYIWLERGEVFFVHQRCP